MKDLFDRYNSSSVFDYKYGRQVTTNKLDGMRDLLYSDYKSRAVEMIGTRSDNQIKRFETEAREKISKGLKPYTKGKYGELNMIAEPDVEKLIAKYVAKKLQNPTPVILWHHPSMVKLATPHMISRVNQILDYEKTKADLYQAIEDLEHNHKQFLNENEKTIASVLEKGHNFML